jgi:VanZ family protein
LTNQCVLAVVFTVVSRSAEGIGRAERFFREATRRAGSPTRPRDTLALQDRGLCKEAMTRLCRIGGWLALATVAFLTLGPVDDRPQVAAAPHLEHFAAFLLLGLVFAVGYPSRPMRAVLIVVGSAILLEILQLLTPDRHARVIDAMAKVTGAAFGITLTRLVLNSWQAKLRSAPAVSTVVRRGAREQDQL